MSMSSPIWKHFVFLAVIWGAAASAPAQVSEVGSVIPANTYTTGSQNVPSVALSAGGSFVVSWGTFGQDAYSSSGLSAQVFDASGAPVGSEFDPHAFPSNQQRHHDSAADAAGNFVVVWDEDFRASNTTIIGRRFAADGTPLDGEFMVSSEGGVSLGGFYPTVDMQPDGAFIVAWDAGQSIRARRFGSDGSPQGDDFVVSTVITGDPKLPDVAIDPAGNVVVAWGQAWPENPEDPQDFLHQSNVHARLFGPDGTATTDMFILNTITTRAQGSPEVDMDQDGNFVAVWNGNPDGGYDHVWVRSYDADGTALGIEASIDGAVNGHQRLGSVAMDPSRNFVVAWQDHYGDVDPDTNRRMVVRARFFGPDGSSLGSFTRNSGDGTDRHPSVSAAGGQAVLAFAAGLTSEEVYAQRYTFGDVVTVTAPTAHQYWGPSTLQAIGFTHTLGGSGHVDIELSRDSGSTWESVVSGFGSDTLGAGDLWTASAGTYHWLVTGTTAIDQAVIRVTSTTAASATDVSPGFTLDVAPILSLSGQAFVTEGNTGSNVRTFTVSLAPAAAQTVTVQYAATGDGATAGADFGATSGTLTFAPGDTVETFPVSILGDVLDEGSEYVDITLSNPTIAALGTSSIHLSIGDDDPLPALTFSDRTLTEGDTGTKLATFAVTLQPASGRSVKVDYATAPGTAVAGTDYVTRTGRVTLNPGETRKTFSITVNGDTADEPDETFFVDYVEPSTATAASTRSTGTIQDNDPAPPGSPVLAVGDRTLAEGDTGTKSMAFTVTLSAAAANTVSVAWATSNGSAIAGQDYTAKTGSVTFTPGQTSRTFGVPVLGDTLDEPAETLTITLSLPINATVGDGQAVGTITDNDPAPPGSPSLMVADKATTEGDTGTKTVYFPITLSAASAQTVIVAYATADATATAGVDYVAKTGSLTFPPGTTQKSVGVVINGDVAAEADETFNLTLSQPVNATIADGTGIGTITDNEP